ncbi:MAG: ribosome maturation factor RimM [Gammaproteobacteria bacterium]|nr:ribosome maturation factor RimM [Gammaproteobacteria bacterium]
MEDTNTEYVSVGKIGSTYGIQGWIKILSFTEPLTNILDYSPWYLESVEGWQPAQVTGRRLHDKSIIVKLANYDSPERSRLLAGKIIAIPRSKLPVLNPGNYYWRDLEGLTVINQLGENLGKVMYVLATGSNDVLVVKGKKEHAIPYLLNDVIISVDLENKVMHVNWDMI